MKPRFLFVLSILLFPILLSAQDQPRSGLWVSGPKGSGHDVVNNAVTKGQFSINQRVVSDDVTVFLACKAGQAGPPALELRFLMPPFRGYNPAAVGKSASFHIDASGSTVPLDSFPVQNSIMFIALPAKAAANQMAAIAHYRTSTISVDFPISNLKGNFVVNLTEPVPAIATVLKACGIAVPEPPPPPAIATSAEKSKYTFEGIHLGMPAQVALAAEKAIATTPVKPGVGGGVDFETRKYYFIGVSTEDHGTVDFYKVCGKTSKTAKAGARSGPLYEEAVKSFGPATGKPPADQHWVQWDKSGGVDARYEWDADEEPGGCLYVTKAAQ